MWNAAIVLSKFVTYVGFACIAGYVFSIRLLGRFSSEVVHDDLVSEFTKGTLIIVLITLAANMIWFLASVGAMAEMGLEGAFDPDYLDMMWSSSTGESVFWKVVGFLIAFVALLVPRNLKEFSNYVRQGALFIGLLCIAFSFTLVGHISNLDLLEKGLLIVHVLIMAWWFGALYPLKRLCEIMDSVALSVVMERFGKQASFLVFLLFIAGTWLSLELVETVDALLFTQYGQTLLIKLVFVVSILILAAKNKYMIVPKLKRDSGKSTLARSIAIEMVLALVLLLITAGLTSVVGPDDI